MDTFIITAIVGLIIFFISLDYSTFTIYTLISMIIYAAIIYFGISQILNMLKSGRSMIFIVSMIILFSIISLIIWSAYTIYINKKIINSQWAAYKCRPYILPFAGWAVGPSGISATSNFTDCMWTMNKSYFDILISPFTDVLKIITDLLSSLVEDIQNIRKMISFMRENMEEMAQDILQKIWASYERISFLFETLLKTFSLLGKTFADLFDVLLYQFYIFASLINGPIGEITKFFSGGISKIEKEGKKFFCFDKNTILNNGKRIKDVQIGDIINPADNTIVLGKIKFLAKDVDMYDYNGIVVSGEHLVKESDEVSSGGGSGGSGSGIWIRVEKSKKSKKIENYVPKYIYCLITNTSKIYIRENLDTLNYIVFTDYNEINNKIIITKIYNYILDTLNIKAGNYIITNNIDHDNEYTNYTKKIKNIAIESGIIESAKIFMANKKFKEIRNIKIGEETLYGKVLAKIKFIYNSQTDAIVNYDGVDMTPNIITYNYMKNKWYPVIESVNINNGNGKNIIMYHLIVEGNILHIKGNTSTIIIRDFEQISNKEVNDEIDKYVESHYC